MLVKGNAAMGKTMLLNQFMALAEKGTPLKCTCLRYGVTPDDATTSVMQEIVSDVAQVVEVGLAGAAKKYLTKNKQKLNALFSAGGLVPLVGPQIKELGGLLVSLGQEAIRKGHARRQLGDMLTIISDRLPENGRLVVFVDPEKNLPPG